MLRRVTTTLTALIAATALIAPAAEAEPAAEIRVDQVGYATGEAKHAYLMARKAATGERFAVVDSRGSTVLTGRIGTSTGAWNDRFPAVHDLDFSELNRQGTYRITVSGGKVSSPTFRIASGAALFDPLVSATNEFFQAQRDGADIIPGRLHRMPSHLVDRRATVYEQPTFTGDDGDVPAAPLKSTGTIIDAEGGWADAGDYLKFTANTAYSLTEMITAFRLGGERNSALHNEIRFGLRWLSKVWDPRSGVLYAQVGLGTGSEEFNFLGDHDVWRLPEADDARQTGPGDPEFFVKFRPVFPANNPGAPLSPNLAGRVAAAFALAAQLEADQGDTRLARSYVDKAAAVFGIAKTTDVGELITAFPHAFYPESSWEDDMELGATELALAARRLGDARADGWARQATHWAKAYIASDTGESLNLYDTSGLAHADLIKFLRSHQVPGTELGAGDLIADLRHQLTLGAEAAAQSPFRTAVDVTNFDAATRSFGFAAVAGLYQRATGDRRFAAFAVQQRNFALGANAWGISLVVGVGSNYPRCPHHQTANITGRLLFGAVVNGPNGADNFEGLDPLPDGGVDCAVSYTRFDGSGSRFMDDSRSWPSSEPAIDFVSTGMLAFALASSEH